VATELWIFKFETLFDHLL